MLRFYSVIYLLRQEIDLPEREITKLRKRKEIDIGFGERTKSVVQKQRANAQTEGCITPRRHLTIINPETRTLFQLN